MAIVQKELTRDKGKTLTNIVKVTSGSDPETADWIDDMYASIIARNLQSKKH